MNAAPEGPVREVVADGWRYRLDLRPQVLSLDAPEHWRDAREPLLPTVPRDAEGFVSAATLLAKAKQFDDGLYAAVEVAAQHGAGRLAGKAGLLRDLAAAVAGAAGGGAALLLAACQLGRVGAPVPEPLREAVAGVIRTFGSDPGVSQPLGFYPWTDELTAIFRQDRLLQTPLRDGATLEALRSALRQVPAAEAAYQAHLRLTARLTNPPMGRCLTGAGAPCHFWPPARSHEVDLFQRLHGQAPVPAGFDLMAELIRRVRAGAVDLTPRADSGWYDYQAWSLGPLVVPDATPEAGKLRLSRGYRRHLEEMFKGALALARETHVKAAGGGYGGCGTVRRTLWVAPALSMEPLPSVYWRRAAAYRFVRAVLHDAFGPDVLRALRRRTPGGPVADDLARELDEMEGLFAGAHVVACRELGLDPDTAGFAAGADGCAARFREWARAAGRDADVGRDARMMVPVFYDVARRRLKVWALLGWRTTLVQAEFVTPPLLRDRQPLPGASSEPQDVGFVGAGFAAVTPVVAEVYVSKPLDRAAFRRHCDRHRTARAILANLR